MVYRRTQEYTIRLGLTGLAEYQSLGHVLRVICLLSKDSVSSVTLL